MQNMVIVRTLDVLVLLLLCYSLSNGNNCHMLEYLYVTFPMVV
jgi:hypothetical protein